MGTLTLKLGSWIGILNTPSRADWMPTANPGGVHKRMLFITNALANATASSVNPKTFQQIADEFNTGKVWGQIAKENGVKLGSIISGIKRSNKAIQTQKRNDNRPTGAQGMSDAPRGKQDRPSQSAGSRSHGNGHGRPK
jgi:hypothetical protein